MTYHSPCRKRSMPKSYREAMQWWRKLRRKPSSPFIREFMSARDMRARGLTTAAKIARYYVEHVRC